MRAALVRWSAVALVGVCVVAAMLPLVAIMLRVPAGELAPAVARPQVRHAVFVSLRATLIAHAIVLMIGTPLAWTLARGRFRGRTAVIAMIELPVVLPPAVAGLGLLAALGRRGLLGGTLDMAGITVPYTGAAVVIALAYVSGAIYVRQAIGAFAAIDEDVLAVARTLGAGPGRLLVRIGIPASLPALEAASALALARGFGEFGATIMFAGSLERVTQTLPLAIYALMDVDLAAALAASVLLVLLGAALLIANHLTSVLIRRCST